MTVFEQRFRPYVPFGRRTLTGGEAGTDVAVLQVIYNQMVQVLNPPKGPPGRPIAVTGKYDRATVQAVKGLQAYFGSGERERGKVGPGTYFLFGQGVRHHATYGGPAYGSRGLRQGDSGGDVMVLQNRLSLFRYGAALGAPADGTFGPRTAAAVRQLQADACSSGDEGLVSDGLAGPATLDATWLYTYGGGRGLCSGRSGCDVAFVQTLLQSLDLYRGPVTGFYDATTEQAVAAFQRSNGLRPDGSVGPETFFALGESNPKPAPVPLPAPIIG